MCATASPAWHERGSRREGARHHDRRSTGSIIRISANGPAISAFTPFPGCVGPVSYGDRGPLGARPRASRRRGGEVEAGRGLHDGAVARHPDALRHRSLLQGRGRLCRRARPGDAHRIPGDRRRWVSAADRLPRSRLGARQPVPPPLGRASSCASASATSPRSTPRPRGCRPTRCGSISAGAITRGRTPTTSRSPRSSASASRAGRWPSASRAPIRATSMSGRIWRRSTFRTTRC